MGEEKGQSGLPEESGSKAKKSMNNGGPCCLGMWLTGGRTLERASVLCHWDLYFRRVRSVPPREQKRETGVQIWKENEPHEEQERKRGKPEPPRHCKGCIGAGWAARNGAAQAERNLRVELERIRRRVGGVGGGKAA